jgi:hypothetical protein
MVEMATEALVVAVTVPVIWIRTVTGIVTKRRINIVMAPARADINITSLPD